MNFLFKISFTNLTRRMYRSILVIVLIAIGVTGMMFMEGFYQGILSNMKGDFIRNSGHIIVEHEKYKDSDLFEDRISQRSSFIGQLEALDNIAIVAPRLINEGLLATASSSRFVRITGIDKEKEKRFGELDNYVIQGHYDFGTKDKRVMVGAKLAEDLELKVGSKLVITTQDAFGEIASVGTRISAIIKTNNPLIDSLTIYMPMQKAEKLFGTPDAAISLAIKVKDDTQLLQIKDKIQTQLPKSIKAYTWGEYFPMVAQIKTTYDAFGTVSYAIVFTIVAIGIFNIILISVLERLKEYGIMMAVGTPFRNIRFQIMLESLILSGAGALLGVIMGSVLLLYYSDVGITYGDAGKSLASFGMGLVIYTQWTFEYVLNAFMAVIIATLVSVWMPIRILKKRNPMAVLHFS